MKRLIAAIFLGLVGSALAGYYFTERWSKPQWDVDGHFMLFEMAFDTYDLFDLGVADITGDESLDLFTVNHSARQVYVSGKKPRVGNLYELGLGQSSSFPGLAASKRMYRSENPGIYLSRVKKNLVIEVVGNPDVSFPIELSLELNWPIVVKKQTNVSVDISASQSNSTIYVANIYLNKGGSVELAGEQNIVELPHRIKLKNEKVRQAFKVGSGFVTPVNLDFEAVWRDRHSMAWHDYNSDGINDVFIGRGGVKGQLFKVSSKIEDELLIRGNEGVRDIASSVGLVKGGCPGRQSAWVDINSDGLLDLHVGCGRFADGNFPDQFYIRDESGKLAEAGSDIGLTVPSVSVFKWLDVDLDNDADLLIYSGNELKLYRQQNNRFVGEVLVGNIKQKPTHISVADINGDLILDAVLVMRKESILLVGNGDSFTVDNLSNFGLPDKLRALQFVDINLDGNIDAHAVPGGIYFSDGNQFTRFKGFSDDTELSSLSEARCSWYDIETNGHMNVVCAFNTFAKKEVRVFKKIWGGVDNFRYWSLHSGEYVPPETTNWLQLDLVGKPGNIEAIGGYVTITVEGKSQRAYVGQFDGAHFSQGHYRLYFGLGSSDSVESVEVTWPDGSVQLINDVKLNSLLVVERDPQ